MESKTIMLILDHEEKLILEGKDETVFAKTV